MSFVRREMSDVMMSDFFYPVVLYYWQHPLIAYFCVK